MHPLACGLFLLFVTFVAFLGWAAYRTTRSLLDNREGISWWIAYALLLTTGCLGGYWCAFYAEYRPNDRQRWLGAPVPYMVLLLEEGNWVDYVSPLTPFLAIADWLAVFFASVLPMSAAVTIRRWRLKYPDRAGIQGFP